MKSIIRLAPMALSAIILASCGAPTQTSSAPAGTSSAAPTSSVAPTSEASSQEQKKAIRPVKTFSYGETMKNAMDFDLYDANRINFYEGGIYEYIHTSITYGYSMNLGTNVIFAYGTYADAGVEDGVYAYTLNKAAEIVLSSYSLAGGYKIHINTASAKQTYPVEMPARVQGEKNMAEKKQDVIDAYGIGTKIFVNNNIISFVDPNSEEENPSSISYQHGLSAVQCYNYYIREIQVKDGLPLTSKGNQKYHGYGMKSIRSIVSKYDGEMTFTSNDGIFNLLITILDH